MQPEYSIITANEQQVEDFIQKLVNGRAQFRYFQKRPISVINNHLITSLMANENGTAVAYGHLEKEDKQLWLGIAVADDHVNKGLGKLMMRHLVEFAKSKQEPLIRLAVDKGNTVAQQLYKQFGFKKCKEFMGYFIFELKLT